MHCTRPHDPGTQLHAPDSRPCMPPPALRAPFRDNHGSDTPLSPPVRRNSCHSRPAAPRIRQPGSCRSPPLCLFPVPIPLPVPTGPFPAILPRVQRPAHLLRRGNKHYSCRRRHLRHRDHHGRSSRSHPFPVRTAHTQWEAVTGHDLAAADNCCSSDPPLRASTGGGPRAGRDRARCWERVTPAVPLAPVCLSWAGDIAKPRDALSIAWLGATGRPGCTPAAPRASALAASCSGFDTARKPQDQTVHSH